MRIIKKQPTRILVITLRFLGDALLTTPLIHSLKQGYPRAAIDVLTFQANASMFEGNADIDRVITLDNKPTQSVFFKLLVSLFRRYDVAISTQAGDRPALCAIMAGKMSLGFVAEEKPSKTWWKKRGLSHWLTFSREYNHAVLENLRFCPLLGIEPSYKLTPPRAKHSLSQFPLGPYAVLHIKPQWQYKEWSREGWHTLIRFLNRHHLHIVLTGSQHERRYLDNLLEGLDIAASNLAGQRSLAEITELISKASLFVGPDTGITHLAAATGVPTFALFGPTDPKKWAPWPAGYASNEAPFSSVGSQHIGNVYLIQGTDERKCVPCQLEGCDNHRNSHSACLDNLAASDLCQTITEALGYSDANAE